MGLNDLYSCLYILINVIKLCLGIAQFLDVSVVFSVAISLNQYTGVHITLCLSLSLSLRGTNYQHVSLSEYTCQGTPLIWYNLSAVCFYGQCFGTVRCLCMPSEIATHYRVMVLASTNRQDWFISKLSPPKIHIPVKSVWWCHDNCTQSDEPLFCKYYQICYTSPH